MDSQGDGPAWKAATMAGLCGSLVGIGLARFAYTPLLPAVIAAGWFSPSQAAYLGAANLIGYLAGALAARQTVRHVPVRTVLRAAMAVAALSFFACAIPVVFAWFFVWRFVAGAAGAMLMVLAAPTVLPLTPASRRGLAGGVIFTGVGLGIAASGVLVPPLLRHGLTITWVGLGVVAIALTLVSWRAWPVGVTPGAVRRPRLGRAVLAVIVIYGMDALGVVPHMIFLVDFVARGLGRGMAAGAASWVAFGLGAMLGPTVAGALADRIGFRAALRLALLVVAVAVAAPLASTAPPALLISAAVVGAFTPGIVPLALGRIHTLLAPGSDAARTAWGGATIAWAVGQAVGAQALSFAFARTGSYALLFAVGTVVLLAALALELAPVPDAAVDAP
jgi:predicted MFS family arabinose efflux permease